MNIYIKGPSSDDTAIICYSRNMRDALPYVLPRLAWTARTSSLPLVVVDDASLDGSGDYAESLEGVLCLRMPAFVGVAAAFNRGVALTHRNNAVLVRGDCLPLDDTWYADVLAAAVSLPQAGIIGALVLTADGRVASAGRRFVTGLGWNHPYCDMGRFEADSVQPGKVEPVEVDGAAGGLVWVRADVWRTTGLFDVHYVSADDGVWLDDFCFAARRKGHTVHTAPAVRVMRLRPGPAPAGERPEGLDELEEREKDLRNLYAASWNAKWGWDPLFPDMNEIRRLYGDTPVCWNTGTALRLPSPAVSSPAPHVDLCMATWNGAAHLVRCLKSLAGTDYPRNALSLRIVDNASTDATPDILADMERHFPFPVHVTRLPVNIGAVAAMNWAMHESLTAGRARFIAKLDDDIQVQPDWLNILLAVFAKRPYAGAVGPRILDDAPEDGKYPRLQCAAFTFYPNEGACEHEADVGQGNNLCRVAHLRGCCNLYRSDALRRCGLLDIRFSPSQWDDVDHQLGLLVAGYELIYQGAAVVRHKRSTGGADTLAQLANSAANKQKMQAKWGADGPTNLDLGLLLSREGRYLPADGDTTALLDAGPAVEQFPRGLSPQIRAATRTRHDALMTESDKKHVPLAELADRTFAEALREAQRGKPRQALALFRLALLYSPTTPAHALALEDLLAELGAPIPSSLRQLNDIYGIREKHAEHCPIIPRRIPVGTTETTAPAGARRVLFVLPSGHDGSQVANLLKRFGERLAAVGFAASVSDFPCPAPTGFDLVHFWTQDRPHETLAQIKAASVTAPQVPRLLSPLAGAPRSLPEQPDDAFLHGLAQNLATRVLFFRWTEAVANEAVAARLLYNVYRELTLKGADPAPPPSAPHCPKGRATV